jgi:hypothetical protein
MEQKCTRRDKSLVPCKPRGMISKEYLFFHQIPSEAIVRISPVQSVIPIWLFQVCPPLAEIRNLPSLRQAFREFRHYRHGINHRQLGTACAAVADFILWSETGSSQMIDTQLSQLLFHYVVPDEELSPENRLYRDNAIAQYWYARVLPHRDRTNES